jgi:hypothetical protein
MSLLPAVRRYRLSLAKDQRHCGGAAALDLLMACQVRLPPSCGRRGAHRREGSYNLFRHLYAGPDSRQPHFQIAKDKEKHSAIRQSLVIR